MLPVLVQLGPVRIYSMGVMMVFALLSGMYWWWKMGRDENWGEIGLFDVYFLSIAVFYLVGRVAYVVVHYGEMGGVWGALSLLSKPGIIYHAGLLGAGVVASRFAQVKEWEIWKAWDSMVVTVSLMMIFGSIGMLLNRGELPGDIVQLVYMMVVFGVVSVVRKNFRFYSWYKGEASVARDGLASLVWIGLIGLYHLGSAIVNINWWLMGGSVLSVVTVVIVVLGRAKKIELNALQWKNIGSRVKRRKLKRKKK